MSGMNKMQRLWIKSKDKLVPVLLCALFFGYIIVMFAYNMFRIEAVQDYLSIVYVWAGYGRYFFIIVLLSAYLKKKDDYKFWAAVLGAEYVLQLILTFVFCVQFTRASMVLFVDLAAYFFIYVTCPAVIAWLIGRISRTVRNDLLSVTILLMLGGIFLFNVIQEILAFPVFHLSEYTYTIISKVFIIFNNSLRNTFSSPNIFAPFFVGVTDVGTVVLWISLFILIFGMIRKKKTAFIMAVPVLGALMLVTLPENKYETYFNQSALVHERKMLDSWNDERVYYDKSADLKDTNIALEYKNPFEPVRAETDFAVEAYELDITAGRKTKFKAVMQLSGAGVNEYTFSLYHGYQIQSITDKEGSELLFQQNDDYFTIFSNGKSLEEITIVYEGTGHTYMASDVYTCLPEYYIYYPVAGKYSLYDLGTQNYSRNISLPETKFSIIVHADYPVYSNLSSNGDNMFSGTGTGATLVGGRYVEICDVDGTTVVYPVLKADARQAGEQYTNIVAAFQKQGVVLDKKTWFVCPYYGGNFGRYYMGDRYMFGSYDELMVNTEALVYYGQMYGIFFNEEEAQ